MYDYSDDRCVICGGDGRIANAFGAHKPCPSCGGTGRRMEDLGHRDVTKTKTAQGRAPKGTAVEKAADAPKRTAPVTGEGITLAKEIQASALSADSKVRLVREIIDHEA